MIRRLSFLVLWLFFGVNALSGQDFFGEDDPEFRTYTDPRGWEITVPFEAKEEVGEQFAKWNAFYDQCWLRWSVGLDEKDAQIHFHLPLKMRYGAEYKALPAEWNPELAKRTGFRPTYRIWEENGQTKMVVMVDFDEKHLLSAFFECSSKHAETGMAAARTLFATLKARPQARYPVSALVSGFFDPVRHTAEEVAGLEGPLKGKVDHILWEMPDHADWDSLYYYDPLLAALPDGGFVVAWRDSAHLTHFQFFSSDMKPRGTSIPFPGLLVHALTGDNTGFAGICSKLRGDYFEYNGYAFLVKFDMQGKEQFRTEIVGSDDISVTNESILFRRRKNQNLAFSGSHYAVYTSIEHNFGPGSGIHQGDFSRFYDEKGVSVKVGDSPTSAERGDNWGVSHSFTKALCWDGELFCYLTVGDGHPRGIAYKRYGATKHPDEKRGRLNVWPIPGDLGDNNVYRTEINGLAANKDLVVGVFTSLLQARTMPGTDYTYNDVFLYLGNKSGSKYGVKPLQATPTLAEVNPRIVRYLNSFLVVWHEWDRKQKYPYDTYTVRYLLLNDKGEKISRPEKIPTWFALEAQKTSRMLSSSGEPLGGTEMVTLKNGDVVWLRYLPEGNNAEIIRIRR